MPGRFLRELETPVSPPMQMKSPEKFYGFMNGRFIEFMATNRILEFKNSDFLGYSLDGTKAGIFDRNKYQVVILEFDENSESIQTSEFNIEQQKIDRDRFLHLEGFTWSPDSSKFAIVIQQNDFDHKNIYILSPARAGKSAFSKQIHIKLSELSFKLDKLSASFQPLRAARNGEMPLLWTENI